MKPLPYALRDKLLEWCFKHTTPKEANDDLEKSPTKKPETPAGGKPIEVGKFELVLDMQKNVD